MNTPTTRAIQGQLQQASTPETAVALSMTAQVLLLHSAELEELPWGQLALLTGLLDTLHPLLEAARIAAATREEPATSAS